MKSYQETKLSQYAFDVFLKTGATVSHSCRSYTQHCLGGLNYMAMFNSHKKGSTHHTDTTTIS